MIEFFTDSIFHDADENGYQYQKNDLLKEIIQNQQLFELYEEISQALRIAGMQRKTGKSELELISTKGCDICFRITPPNITPPNKKKRCAQHDRQTNIAGYNKGRRIKEKCLMSSKKSNPRLQLNNYNFKDWLKTNAPLVYQTVTGCAELLDAVGELNGDNKILLEEYQKMAGIKEGEKIEVFYDQIESTYMLTANPSEKEKINFGKMGYAYYKINKYNIITQRYFLNAEIWIEAEKSRFHGGSRKGAGRKKDVESKPS